MNLWISLGTRNLVNIAKNFSGGKNSLAYADFFSVVIYILFCAMCVCDGVRGQRRMSEPLELKLQMVVNARN